MAKEKISFKEFLLAVAPEHRAFVEKLNDKLIGQGCGLVKQIGCFASKASGHGFTGIMPADMRMLSPLCLLICRRKWLASRDCKRLINPDACSDTCVKGFVYSLNGDTHKKCRNDGMFFLLTNETAEHIAGLVCAEVTVRKSASGQQKS